jgi:hypothetical protein
LRDLPAARAGARPGLAATRCKQGLTLVTDLARVFHRPFTDGGHDGRMEQVNVMAEIRRGVFSVEVGGEFDDAAAQRLARTLGEADFQQETRVDFSRARSIDMRALYVLASALRELRKRVELTGLSHRDSRLLQYLGVPMPAYAAVIEDHP